MTIQKELLKIDRLSKLPLYDQIERNLRDLIINGRLEPGEPVPSEFELADLYGVSRLTVRRALDELVRQNWLSRRQGVGTFVNRPSVAAIATSKLSFTTQMLAIGRKPGSRLISTWLKPADSKVANFLGLQEGEQVIEITRLRLADDAPILFEKTYLSTRFEKLGLEKEWDNLSIYRFLNQHYQISITGMDQTFKPVLLTDEQAEYLETQPGSPAIYCETVAFSSEGEPIEYSWSVSSGEKSEFYFRFRREDIETEP